MALERPVFTSTRLEEDKRENRKNERGEMMSRLWIIPICLFIIGMFAVPISMFATDIRFSMDNNSLEAMRLAQGSYFEPPCEEGCYYIIDNWVGVTETDHNSVISSCRQYCDAKRGNMVSENKEIPKYNPPTVLIK